MADNLDRLISAIEQQNKRLEDLIQENERLRSTPFDMTSLEKLKVLSLEVKKEFENLNKTLEASNDEIKNIDTSYGNLFKDSKDILKDVETLREEIERLANGTDDEQEKAKKLKKILEQVTNSASQYYRKANEEQEKLNKRIVEGTHAMDDAAEKWEQRTRALRKGASEVSKGLTQIYQSVTKTLEPWAKANQEAMNYARTMGMSQKTADGYLSKTISWAAKNNIGILFNKSTDELIKMQSKYSEVLGRNVQLTSEQKKDMLAIDKFLGEDGMMDIANNLENFGLGMSDSADFIHEKMNEATKSGIAASKLTKTIRENIKMAQNYTFKHGLDGLANMAKKAIELKTNMSLINGFIEKTSTVEGAITTGAHLQVLGGNYAVGSDPLSMLHDSLNNVEGLFDRAVSMASGKVFYNEETGNFEMGAMDRYMMKQAATVMGINPEEMMNVAFRKASTDKVEEQAMMNSELSGDADMISMVKNLATWDKGRAVINIDGKDVDVKDIKAEDKAKLEAMQRTDTQNLQDIAIRLRSWDEILGGTKKEIKNEQADATQGIASSINDILRTNTKMLDITAKIGAWINIIGGGAGILAGVWTTAAGVLRMGKGIGNLGRGIGASSTKPIAGNSPVLSTKSGILRGGREVIHTGSKGGKYRQLANGKYQNIKTGAISGSVKSVGATTQFTKPALLQSAKSGLKVGGVGAVIGAGLSLGTDLMTGEFKKDVGSSIGRAAGPAIGSVLGGVVGGPLGAMIGGYLGSVITEGVQKSLKEDRAKLRKKISSELSNTMPKISGLFDGENALQGNYTKSQLKDIAKALEDNKIDESDNLGSGILRKLRANNDLVRMQEHGVDVNIEMARGGYLNIPKHSEEKMPVSSSNIDDKGIEMARGGYLNGPKHSEWGIPISDSNIINKDGEMARGGYLNGPKHSEGGMPISGSNIVVEGGEFVVNRRVTSVLRPYLERMNDGDFSMIAKQPLGTQMRVHKQSSDGVNMPHNSKVSVEPISVNLSGTIKLDTGSKNLDISNELLSNPLFINRITDMISKQLNILDNGTYNKNIFKQKFV